MTHAEANRLRSLLDSTAPSPYVIRHVLLSVIDAVERIDAPGADAMSAEIVAFRCWDCSGEMLFIGMTSDGIERYECTWCRLSAPRETCERMTVRLPARATPEAIYSSILDGLCRVRDSEDYPAKLSERAHALLDELDGAVWALIDHLEDGEVE